jgi:hypothetical protein
MASGLLLAVATILLVLARSDHEDCQNRVSKAQADLARDASRHGQGGRQVRDDLNRLDAARQRCAKHHADWDHSRDKD